MPDGPAMSDRPDPPGRPPGAECAFDERLTVPWWWWPFGLGVAALLAAEVHMGYPGVRAWLPYLLTVPLAVAVLIRMGCHRVRLRGEELHVGRAHVPVRHLGQVEVIPPAGKRRALGPDLDPAAFVQHKAWVGPLVRVELTDPQDSTPYWIFSVRRAADLATLLQAPDAQASDMQASDSHRQGSDGHVPPGAPTGG